MSASLRHSSRLCAESALLATILTLTSAPGGLAASPPVRLTLNPGQDVQPAWDPRGNLIVYMRSAAASGSGVPFDLYGVQADEPGESIMATGPTLGFGLASSPSWVGATGFVGIEERVIFHEYMRFDVAQAPFARVTNDGSDAAFTRLLLIPGGGGGGWIRFSRDGSAAMWRWATSGGSGTQQIRVGPVAGLTGQNAGTAGSVVAETFHASEQRMVVAGALSPDGSLILLCLPAAGPDGSPTQARDIWLYRADGSQPPVNLTQEGVHGVYSDTPDFMPDGQSFLYSRFSGVAGQTWDLCEMRLDGTGRRQITDTPFFGEYGPSVSPDGRRVAFAGTHIAGQESTPPALPEGEAANSNIYVMALEGGDDPGELVLAIHRAVELEWETRPGEWYQVQFSDNGDTWDDLGDPVEGTGEVMRLFQPARDPDHRWYRVVALP